MAPLDLDAAPLAELPPWVEGCPAEVQGAVLEAARRALKVAAKQDGEGEALWLYAAHGAAVGLSSALRLVLPAVAAAVAEGGAVGLTCYLEGLGEHGRRAAGRTRKDGSGLTVARALVRVALVLWRERERAEAEKKAIRSWPGMPLALVDGARVGTWGRVRVDGTTERGPVLVDGAGVVLAQREPDRVPSVPVALLDRMEEWTREGAPLLGSLLGHRFLRWLTWEAHTRHQQGHAPILEVKGGWRALAHAVGGTSKKDVGRLRAVVCCLDAYRFAFPDGSVGRLVTLHYREDHGPGAPAVVALTPGAPLLPSYIFDLRRPDWKTIPVLAELPPMVGRSRDHGALAELHWRVLVELRRRCREMVGLVPGEDLGAPLAPGDWRTLADLACLPSSTLNLALDRWTRDGSDGPAFLRLVSRDRYTLAPAHDGARRVLLNLGWNEARGSEDGKRSARARGGAGPTRRRRGKR